MVRRPQRSPPVPVQIPLWSICDYLCDYLYLTLVIRVLEDFCLSLASDEHYKFNFITCPKQEETNGFSLSCHYSKSHDFLSTWRPGIILLITFNLHKGPSDR